MYVDLDLNKNEWLTDDLRNEVISVFQPDYNHPLTETEVFDIADSLANLTDLWIKFNWRVDHAQ